jgi:hypothetical protein
MLQGEEERVRGRATEENMILENKPKPRQMLFELAATATTENMAKTYLLYGENYIKVILAFGSF